jgi:hypothetical protein
MELDVTIIVRVFDGIRIFSQDSSDGYNFTKN